jgi:PAS domain S-box-containing protein
MTESDRRRPTLLVVSSRQADRKFLNDLLSSDGYRLFFALSGAQVISDSESIQPDLILLDSTLPDMTGIEVCRRLQADQDLADVPVLVMVEEKTLSDPERYYKAGAADLIDKPLNQSALERKVGNLAQLGRYRRESPRKPSLPSRSGHPSTQNLDLNVLERVIASLSVKQDQSEILQSACEVLAMAFDGPNTSAWILDRDHGQFNREVSYDVKNSDQQAFTREGRRSRLSDYKGSISISTPWLQDSITERQPTALSWVLGDPHLVPFEEDGTGKRVASTLILPIPFQDEVAGFFEVTFSTPRGVSDQEVVLAQSIASAVGEAIETARLHQRLQNYADFLDQALAQRTLELKGERYRTQSILEALGEAVVITDLEGNIQYVNHAAVELTGYSREELLSQRMRLWRSHRQTAELYTQMLTTLQDGVTWRGEVINERKDGTLYNAALTVAPYFDPRDNGRPIGHLSVQRDITPVKEAERLKDQFVSNVSHELRTPLSVLTLLTGNLDTLYFSLDDEKRRKLIRDIRGHVQVLNDLVSSVLEISRLDGGRVPRDYKAIDLVELAREEVEKQTPLAKNKFQSLTIQDGQPLNINGNEGQLRQVIRNLLNNAIKYTPRGGAISCECKLHGGASPGSQEWPGSADLPKGRWAAFRVCDSGAGIDQEDLPRLFERFYRVKSQGDIPGAGLGLSIAKELIQLHSGQIAVSSTCGEGSIFAVYLPLSEEVDHVSE